MAKKISKFLIVASFLTILFLPARTYAVDWFPLVPCGLNQQPANATRKDTLPDGTQVPHNYKQDCNQCLLIELGKNIIDMTFFAIVPSVGTLMFLIAGFIILLSAREGKSGGVETGKKIMTDTAIGIAIILSSWLIANFILKSLANDQISQTPWYTIQCKTGTLKDIVGGTNPPPPTGGVLAISTSLLSDATKGTAYSQPLSATGGTPPYAWSLASGAIYLPDGVSVSGSNISGTPTATGTFTFTVIVGDSSAPQKTATKQLTIKVNLVTSGGGSCSGTSCLFNNSPDVLSCSAVDPGDGCNQSAIGVLSAAITAGASGQNICSGVDTVKLLKAIVSNESQGRIDIPSSDGLSAGPFQLTVATATQYKTQCGVTASIDFAWLRRADTVSAQACIAAKFIASFASVCGCNVRQLAAGYNGGGGGACNVSADCGTSAGAGQCSACAGQSGPTRRWECLWEDTAHASCNSDRVAGTLAYTRRYAPKVEFCYNTF